MDSNQVRTQPQGVGLALGSRERFIMRTYGHLAAAMGAFVLLEVVMFQTGIAHSIARFMLGTSWLIILGAFMVASWLFTHMAHRAEALGTQYLALGGFVVAEAVLFAPLLFIANHHAPGAISSAATVTLIGFAGLTWVVFHTRKDFSFLGSVLRWGMVMALVAIVCGVIFGFQLGTFFSLAMVALAGGAILYDTSNVLHHYPDNRYVGAALRLFASVALMLWYVLQLFMSRD